MAAAPSWASGRMARVLVPVVGQAGISLSNLGVGLLLAREAPGAEYGLYVLGFSIGMFFFSLHDGFITGPVTVRGARLKGPGREAYLAATGRSVLTTWLLLALAGAAIGELIALAWPALYRHGCAAAIAFMSFGWIVWDYERARWLSMARMDRLLRTDLAYFLLLLAGISVLWLTQALTAPWALTAIGAATLSAWLLSTGARLWPDPSAHRLRRRFAAWWGAGRWALLSGQVSWLQSQSYIYLVSSLIGLAGLARVSAVRLLFAPLATLVAAWARSALPHVAQQAAAGRYARMRTILVASSAALLGVLVVWTALVLVASDWIAQTVFKGRYPHIGTLAACWGIVFAANQARSVWQTGVRACGEFKPMFRVSLYAAVLSVASTVAGIALYGEPGAVIGLAAAELFAAAWFHRLATARVRSSTR